MPGREVEVEDDLRALEAEGHTAFAGAVAFLREYSGLDLPWDRDGFADEIWFSAARICQDRDPSWVGEYAARAGTALVPVGASNTGHLMLLIGEDGRWFGGFDDEFGELGEDLLSCLDNLILEKGFTRKL